MWTLELVETKKPTDQLVPGDKIQCVYRGSPVDGRVVVGLPLSHESHIPGLTMRGNKPPSRTQLLTCPIVIIQVNTPECFSFSAALPVSIVLKGIHQYFLEPSKVHHGGTKLILHEDFTGLFAFSLRRGSGSREYLERDYQKFIESLKRRVESMPA